MCTINLLFVCIEIHSREHLPRKTPLPIPELRLSSKRDPCKVQQLRMTPSPPGNAVPGVLTHTHTPQWFGWQVVTSRHCNGNVNQQHNINTIIIYSLSTYGRLGPVYFCLIFPILHFSAEPKAAKHPAPLLASVWQAAAAPAPAPAAGLGHLPLLLLFDPTHTQTHQHCCIMQQRQTYLHISGQVKIPTSSSICVTVPVAAVHPVLSAPACAALAAVGPR